MTFPKVALPETISARWRMQWNISLPCVVYVPQRNKLVWTQSRTSVQIYLYNFQIIAGSYPTTFECGQIKFVCLQLTVQTYPFFWICACCLLAQEGDFEPPCKLWKTVAECTVVTFSKLFHSSIDFLTLVTSASGLWGRGRMPASQNYRILKRLNQFGVFITIFNKCC